MSCSCHDKETCSNEEEKEERNERLKNILLLVWGGLCLIIGFIFQLVDTRYTHVSWSLFADTTFYSSLTFFSFMVYTIGYLPLFFNALKETVEEWKEGHIFNENLLMLIATFGAFAINEHPESLFVILFAIIGEMLEDYATSKSKKSIVNLINSMPLYAHLLKNENIINTKPEELSINDLIEIRPGEKIPVDGIIKKGFTSLDVSSLTGESLPKDVHENDLVYSGSINLSSAIVVEVKKEFKDSTLTKILNLVEDEQNKKTKTEKFITRFASYYTPVVMVLAVMVFLFGFGFSSWSWSQGGREWLYKALSFLLISCPCSLVIAVPITFFASIGKASKLGMLIKGSSPLEKLAHADTFIFDKTGTLTKGEFSLINNVDEDVLQLAASLESKSSHPLASAVINANKKPLYTVESFNNIPGLGIEGKINNHTYFIGSKEFLKQHNISNIKDESTPYKVLYFASEDSWLANFIVADEIKGESKEVITLLKNNNCKTIMLSGDEEEIAKKTGDEIGLDESIGNLSPEEKLAKVKEISKESRTVYIGDGINDSPSLLASDVPIAMGGLGSDAAIEAADIVIMTDNLRHIVEAKRLSKRTLFIAKGVIVLSLLLKALVMILVVSGILNESAMIVSGVSDTGVMIVCVLLACSMLLYRPKHLSTKQN